MHTLLPTALLLLHTHPPLIPTDLYLQRINVAFPLNITSQFSYCIT